METAKLKKFAQFARRSLLEQVSAKLKLVLAENSAARRESLDAITEALAENGRVIVCGCLGGRTEADGSNFIMAPGMLRVRMPVRLSCQEPLSKIS